MPLPQELHVDASDVEVRHRLSDGLMVVGSVWFPTRSEMYRWHDSPARLYLRWIDRGDHPARFEIGPRVETMPAARFCPVLRGELCATAGGAKLRWRKAFPRGTTQLLAGFTLALVGWAGWLGTRIAAGDDPPHMVLIWLALAATLYGGAAVSWRYGVGLLEAQMPWLRAAVQTPIDDGDAWG